MSIHIASLNCNTYVLSISAPEASGDWGGESDVDHGRGRRLQVPPRLSQGP